MRESDETNAQHACKHRLLRLQQLHTAQTATPREGDERQVADIPEPPKFGPKVSVIFLMTALKHAHTPVHCEQVSPFPAHFEHPMREKC